MYLYKLVPTEKVWETGFFTLTTRGYPSVRLFVYFLLDRFIPLVLFIIVFFIVRPGWNHPFVVVIFLYLHRLLAVVSNSSQVMDEYEYIYTLPVALIVIGILYYMRHKLKNRINIVDLKEQLDDEIQKLKDQNNEKQG